MICHPSRAPFAEIITSRYISLIHAPSSLLLFALCRYSLLFALCCFSAQFRCRSLSLLFGLCRYSSLSVTTFRSLSLPILSAATFRSLFRFSSLSVPLPVLSLHPRAVQPPLTGHTCPATVPAGSAARRPRREGSAPPREARSSPDAGCGSLAR